MSRTVATSRQPVAIGTAGWTVPSRYAEQVPHGGSHLERYARRLGVAEINSSFHRPHRRSTYERWAASTPEHFRFAAKLPKAMTHERGLADCTSLLDGFAEQVSGLGGKLAVLLMQTPPKFAFDHAVTGEFVRELRRRFGMPIVIEPRHASWFTPQADAWLADQELARAAADPARVNGAERPGGWRGLIYYRWHGSPRMYYSSYDPAALQALRRALDEAEPDVPRWCIFDNTASGAALGDALALAALAP